MNRRLEEIFRKNSGFEKQTPYNFCDRWCERCIHEKQIRCKLYQDELEQKLTCIAHGKDEDDLEITKAVLEEQFNDIEKKLSDCADKFGVDFDIDEPNEENEIDFKDLPEEVQKHIKFVENNPLDITAEQYCNKAHTFLEKTFYKKDFAETALRYDFETISWYHTLLPVKLHRALCGFHEPVDEDEFALYDAIAQFEICKKAIAQSIEALRRIDKKIPVFHTQISELIALLGNINSRINTIEKSVQ